MQTHIKNHIIENEILSELASPEVPVARFKKSPRVVVVDDDPLFLRMIEKVAKDEKITLTTCQSLSELAMHATTQLFDIAIVDYYLDGIKGQLRGNEVASIFKAAPVILISHNTEKLESETFGQLPNSVRGVVNKSEGPMGILNAVLKEWSYQRLRAIASAIQENV